MGSETTGQYHETLAVLYISKSWDLALTQARVGNKPVTEMPGCENYFNLKKCIIKLKPTSSSPLNSFL